MNKVMILLSTISGIGEWIGLDEQFEIMAV